MSEDKRVFLEVVLAVLGGAFSLVLIPWCVWVSSSIFALRQQTALIVAQIDVMKEIKDILSNRGGRS